MYLEVAPRTKPPNASVPWGLLKQQASTWSISSHFMPSGRPQVRVMVELHHLVMLDQAATMTTTTVPYG